MISSDAAKSASRRTSNTRVVSGLTLAGLIVRATSSHFSVGFAQPQRLGGWILISMLSSFDECIRHAEQGAHPDDLHDVGLVAHQPDEGGDGDDDREPVEAAGERRLRGALRPESVPGEEYRQIENHADHRSRNGCEWCGEAEFAARGLDQRRAREDEPERRQKGE